MNKRKKNRREYVEVAAEVPAAGANQDRSVVSQPGLPPARPFRRNSTFLVVSTILLLLWMFLLAVMAWMVNR